MIKPFNIRMREKALTHSGALRTLSATHHEKVRVGVRAWMAGANK